MAEQALTWEAWSAELERIYREWNDPYGAEGLIKACGEECWRESFSDGYTPQEAADNDRSCWEE